MRLPPGDQAPFMIMLAVIMCGAAVLIFRPIAQAILRRVEGRYRDGGELAERVADLEHRLAEVEQDRLRVAELEERVDFAERLLSKGTQEPNRAP